MVRPKLREDCVYVPVDDGVYLETSMGSVRLKGPAVYQLVDRLAPYLDGEHALDDLTRGLPGHQRELVTGLTATLARHGVLRDAAADLAHTLTAEELAAHAQEIAFIDLVVGSGPHHFQRFRESRVLLIGAGAVLVDLIGVMLRLGLRSPWLLATEEAPGDPLTRRVDALRARDRPPTASPVNATVDWARPSSVRAALAGHDIVIHCSDRPMVLRALRIGRAARSAEVAALQAVVVDGTAWVGPIPAADGTGCWECGWRRLLGTMAADDPSFGSHAIGDHPDAPPETDLSDPMSALIAGTLGLAAFTHLATAHRTGPYGRLLSVELATAQTAEHEIVPHPRCLTCARPAPASPAARRASVRDLTRRSSDLTAFGPAAARLVAAPLGPIGPVEESGQRQLPMNVSSVRVADPTTRGHGRRLVTGVGRDLGQARQRAVTAAIELAAARLVECRERADAGTHMWAWDPVADAVIRVPAELFGMIGPFGPAGPAVAAGRDWAEAVGRGLLRHCHRLAMSEPTAAGPGRALDMNRYASPAEAVYLADAARPAGDAPSLVDLTGRLGVPTVAVRAGDTTLAGGTARDLAGAAKVAIEGAIARAQGLDAAPTTPPDVGARAWTDDLPRLAGRLSRLGWWVVATPVDDDASLTAVLPCVAAVAVVARPDDGSPR